MKHLNERRLIVTFESSREIQMFSNILESANESHLILSGEERALREGLHDACLERLEAMQ